MCGKDVPSARPMMVEGTKLNLCPNCSKFGDTFKASSRSGDAPVANNALIQERLEKRERRMQTRDIYATAGATEVVENYGEIIRKAREKKGMSDKDFAASIGEKEGTIKKIETQALIPDDKIIIKIEKALNVSLRETVSGKGVVGGGKQSSGMTLANFIREEK